MNNPLKYIDTFLAKCSLGCIWIYQKTLSPDSGPLRFWLGGTVCSHTPHCSEYGKECFEKYGFIRGFHHTIERISQCTGSSSVSYDPSSYRVVFFSGSPIGVPFLEGLENDDRFELVGVVTQPPVPSGRGMKVKENIIQKTTKSFGRDIPTKTPNSLRTKSKKRGSEAKEFSTRLEKINPDLMVVVAYGNILPQSVLNIPHFGTINVHGSLLPKYRGASPLQSVFIKDHDASGVTVMKMNAKMDEGDILSLHPMPIGLDRTVRTLIDEIKQKAPGYMLKTLRNFCKGRIDPVPQEESHVTYCSKISKEDGFVDLANDSLETIYKKYQAYALRPKIYTKIGVKRIIIEQITLDPHSYDIHKDKPLLIGEELNQSISLLKVKPEGKSSMTRESFLLGNKT